MKHLFVTILLLCAVNLNLSAQYDPCGELRVAMYNADRLVFEGKLDEALAKLNMIKDDPEMQNCPDMKDGFVDFKINYVEERIAKRIPSYKSCPDGNHPHLIDLGLPSGTKWACCNVDAKKPEDAGGYYAWGETDPKSDYSWSTYKHCDGSQESCHNLGSSISCKENDVVHVKWGGSWQMPTDVQLKELFDNCTNEWTKQNGVNGRKFSSKKNGASIFLPAAGWRGSLLNRLGSRGYYWSGIQSKSISYNACFLYFDSDRANSSGTTRYYGFTVRPVSK